MIPSKIGYFPSERSCQRPIREWICQSSSSSSGYWQPTSGSFGAENLDCDAGITITNGEAQCCRVTPAAQYRRQSSILKITKEKPWLPFFLKIPLVFSPFLFLAWSKKRRKKIKAWWDHGVQLKTPEAKPFLFLSFFVFFSWVKWGYSCFFLKNVYIC